MPLLPLLPDEVSLVGGDVPVSGPEDVLPELPRPHKNPEVAPVRDAIVAGMAAAYIKYQNISSSAAGQTDPMRATGDYLRSFAEERGIVPGRTESEESIRSRLFTAPKLVAPKVIVDGVNNIIAGYSDKQCRFAELDVDGFFVHDGTGTWNSFVDCDPDYPDRYYDERPWLRPGGAVPSSGYRRSFVLRIPPLETANDLIPYALDTDEGIFLDSGSVPTTLLGGFLFEDSATSDDLYNTIIGYVESVKGHGITWTLIVDPSL